MHTEKNDSVTSLNTTILLAAVGLCLTWCINTANYSNAQPWIVALLIMGTMVAAAILRSYRYADRLTAAYAVAVGCADRIGRAGFQGSDVIDATREAIRVLFSGHNPYFHVFMTTRPPGAPFPYFPGELFFYGIPYAIFHSIDTVDRFSGIAILFLLISLAPIVGTARASLATALYAVFSLAALRSVDGSNDTSLAFLMVFSIVLLRWSEHTGKRSLFVISALLFGWALLFKALSWPFAPFLIAYLFKKEATCARRYALIAGGAAFFFLVPFFFPSPIGIIANFYQGLNFHGYIEGPGVWSALLSLGVPIDPRTWILPAVQYGFAGILLFVLLKRRETSLSRSLFNGLGVLATLLSFARWSTSPYFTYAGILFILAIACEGDSVSRYRAHVYIGR